MRTSTAVARTRIASRALLAVVLAGSGCDPQARVAERAAVTATEISAAGMRVVDTAMDPLAGAMRACVNIDDGYSIRYPVEWYVNHPDAARACSLFGPGIVVAVAEEGETSGGVISLRLGYTTFATFVDGEASPGEVSREPVMVAGRDALRVEGETLGDDDLPAGVRWYEYVIDLGDGRVLIARTYDRGTIPFAQKRRVLDAMVGTLTLS
jgi:hypothetical protein